MEGKHDDPARSLSVDLVRRIQGGDRSAWEALYLRYRDALLFSIRCRLGPRGRQSVKHYFHACLLNKIRSKAHYHAALKRR